MIVAEQKPLKDIQRMLKGKKESADRGMRHLRFCLFCWR